MDHPEVLARYGERGLARTIWLEWRGSVVLLASAFVFYVGRQQSKRANEILENIELNRQLFYDRDFQPLYVEGAPGGVYDGAVGYSTTDATSGLVINADHKIASDESRESRRARLAQVEISDAEVAEARRLLQSRRYEGRP